MKILNFKNFSKKYNSKNDTMKELEFQTVCKYKIYPRDSIISTSKGFVNIDNEAQGGTHWTCFYKKK